MNGTSRNIEDLKIRFNLGGIINLTPHEIKLKTKGTSYVFPPSGVVARVKTEENPYRSFIPELRDIPIFIRNLFEIEGLPPYEEGEFYLVSSMVLSALSEDRKSKRDVFAPDTGNTALRNNEGQIEAVTRFVLEA